MQRDSHDPDAVGTELVRLKRSMDAVRSGVLEAGGHGLEGSGMAVLFHLATAGGMRASALADRLGLDPSTTSRHVATLERSGHVERVADPADGRAWLVQATTAGVRAFEETRALRNALVAHALADWTPSEVEVLAASLARFNDSVAALDVASLTPLVPTRKDRR